MNEAKIFLHFALSEKNEDERLEKVIKACKIISEHLPNDSMVIAIKDIEEILPKLINLLNVLETTIDMLINAFIDKFAERLDDVSKFYAIFTKEFERSRDTKIRVYCS